MYSAAELGLEDQQGYMREQATCRKCPRSHFRGDSHTKCSVGFNVTPYPANPSEHDCEDYFV